MIQHRDDLPGRSTAKVRLPAQETTAADSIRHVLAGIAGIPHDWHQEGSPLPLKVLEGIVRHVGMRPLPHTVETGTGRSSLLFSHLSLDHTVFTIKDTVSLRAVRSSPLLNNDVVHFIEGPTQLTLSRFQFKHSIQVALIDGPHAYPFPDLEYYHIYPHLEIGGFLILDDINIPSIFNLFSFLEEDVMFKLVEIVGNTAFFQRTGTPVFDPIGDAWWTQRYNVSRFPVSRFPRWGTFLARVRGCVPVAIRRPLRKVIRGRVSDFLGRLMAPEHQSIEVKQIGP